MTSFDTDALEALRQALSRLLSPSRYAHTLGVEQTAACMAELYCPEDTDILRAAALLHDLTKEYDAAMTQAVLKREGRVLRPDEAATPAIHHAITAPLEILRLYPQFADPTLLDAVRWHTTGRAGMTLAEAILYLADVIEPGRTYAACVLLREHFWGADISNMSRKERMKHLTGILLESLESVRDSLVAKGAVVCDDTIAAIRDLKTKETLL